MSRRGHSTTVGKFAKIHHDRRVSEMRIFGELLRREQECDYISHTKGIRHSAEAESSGR